MLVKLSFSMNLCFPAPTVHTGESESVTVYRTTSRQQHRGTPLNETLLVASEDDPTGIKESGNQ